MLKFRGRPCHSFISFPSLRLIFFFFCRCGLDGHAPYDENAMLFMDYRTDYANKQEMSEMELKELSDVPTFLYAMPMGRAPNGRRKIFFEEVKKCVLYLVIFMAGFVLPIMLSLFWSFCSLTTLCIGNAVVVRDVSCCATAV